MKLDNQYVCVQIGIDINVNPWVRKDTFSYTMRDSKIKLLGGGTVTWKEAKKAGWKCVKVQINITFI